MAAAQPPHSAGLLISVYVDADDGARWHARPTAFDDAAMAGLRSGLVSEPEQLLEAVRRWLDRAQRSVTGR
jgi:hypothetical protein